MAAVRVLAAAARLRAKRCMVQEEVEREHFERIVADVRAVLDAEIFAAGWGEGQAMAPEQVIQMAVVM